MREPTESEVRRFWEWCGFKRKLSASENPHYWIDPEGKALSQLPPIDLNNLFQWAVPKLGNDCWIIIDPPNGRAIVVLGFIEEGEGEAEDPALALFWAIWKVIDKDML